MERLKYLFLILATASTSNSVKINMQGSVSLGKDIMDTISYYLRSQSAMAIMRRSGPPEVSFGQGTEQIKWTIESANVGKGLKIYTGPVGDFIKEYIVILAQAIENIFDGILTHNEEEPKRSLFVEHLKPVLSDIRVILKEANTKIIDDKEVNEWITVLKRIGARYQKAAINFIEERLDGDPQDISNVKKKLIQKIVIALILVENKYETKLCQEQKICEKDHIVTSALNSLLADFNNTNNDRAMEFVKYFYDNLPENMFYFLNMDTTHELQVILSDLSYTKDAPTKDVLLTVHKTVDGRYKLLKNGEEISKAYDQQLINVILSDMDYFYRDRRKNYPFDHFLGQLSAWQKTGGKFSQQMRTVMKDIKEQLQKQLPALLEKMAYQVRVFLELTVDPEKI